MRWVGIRCKHQPIRRIWSTKFTCLYDLNYLSETGEKNSTQLLINSLFLFTFCLSPISIQYLAASLPLVQVVLLPFKETPHIHRHLSIILFIWHIWKRNQWHLWVSSFILFSPLLYTLPRYMASPIFTMAGQANTHVVIDVEIIIGERQVQVDELK